MRRFLAFLLLLIFGVGLVLLMHHGRLRDQWAKWQYDWTHKNPYMADPEKLRAWLAKVPKVPYEALPPAFQQASGFGQSRFQNIPRNRLFYRFTKAHFYQKVLGENRLKDLLPKDAYYQQAVLHSNAAVYALLDVRVLEKALALQDRLEALAYDRDAFWIRSGPRYPTYNQQVGGASMSRHLYGEALDLVIGDINQDGHYSDEDKKIVLRILDQEIIRDAGGIGRYPGTRSVHLDVRGYKARWDEY